MTIAFERLIGEPRWRSILVEKRRLLGRPTRRVVARTHFRVPVDTSQESLAFLVSQGSLLHGSESRILAAAASYVHDNIGEWRRGDVYELPQWQLLETYSLQVTD